jgi:hypothetical protein
LCWIPLLASALPFIERLALIDADRIKPYLVHEDRFLREAAFEYFGENGSQDPDLASLAIEALDRFEDRSTRNAFSFASHFVLTESTLDQVLDRLESVRRPDIIEKLGRWIASSPGELLRSRRERILACRSLDADYRRSVEHRCELVSLSSDQIWEELQKFSRQHDQNVEMDDASLLHAKDLTDALSRRDVPDEETIVGLLQSDEIRDGWLEIFLTDLAGRRRLSSAVPVLVERLYLDDADLLLSYVTNALARIADPEAARLIRTAYAGIDGDLRFFAIDVLGRLKHPESEEAILALLKIEDDLSLRTILCKELCSLFSERGIELVRRQIRTGYDQAFTSLEDDLLPVLAVLNIDLPEVKIWKQDREQRARQTEARLAQLESPVRPPLLHNLGQEIGALPEIDDDFEDDDFEDDEDELIEASEVNEEATPPVEVTRPIQYEQARVGRNDACPCGSGKKFKKCCGRSA